MEGKHIQGESSHGGEGRMKKKIYMSKLYPITSVCKEDIIQAFASSGKLERVKQRITEMDDAEMRHLASKMANDYLEQLYWDSLRIIFEDRFLEQ